MMTIEIPTDHLNRHLDDEVMPGAALAELLRKVADRVEQDIHILPGTDGEWRPEITREAMRTHGVLVGAVITLDADSRMVHS